MIFGMPRPIVAIEISPDQRSSLRQLVRCPTTPQRMALRARIILSSAEGLSQQAVASRERVRRRIVGKWCKRFRSRGLEGLLDAKGRGRKTSLPEEKQAQVLTLATQPPEIGRAHV